MERALPQLVSINKKPARGAVQAEALSQNEQAYARLKEALTTLAYKPGDYLNIANLMKELTLGRTPINHALHRLSNEGLVQIIPRKGVMVSPLSLDDALDLIDVRMANESLCARMAAVKITKAELQQLKNLAREIDEAVERRNMAQVMNSDRLFHEHIATAARNQILAEILKVLHARSQRFWAISLSADGHLEEVKAEHRIIIDALSKADPDTAAAAVEAHVLSFKRSLLHTK
ncbi:MAG: GntR family transcriptional regulator [Sterolibacterium sp.]|jgi:DNA-binding GntR family transcriptional regulator